ncbi:DUF4097 family beta strand repeat-containing protein [Micromonospora mirobrigensis]|uniref:Putative adhesin n=1 Tax=Micromonospora mirobrigensis TaxID=262898 RepID=A0A1C5AIY7_9ACTN|nr:DUF4097 family beta strand repeat-containing protein [Micromonospora mirobrigensis]SCF45198.1 Putative adhesin [Micromonospora mirobrigensis]
MSSPRTRHAAGAVALLILLAGCDTIASRRLDFDTTESARVDRVTVLPGAGDVVLHGTGPAGQVRVKRTLRYQGDQPGQTWRVDGAALVLDTDCGPRCSVSYDVTLPKGVEVRGETASGNVELAGTGPVQFTARSGDVRVAGATGAVRIEANSGNVEVSDVTGPTRLRANSGNVTGTRLAGPVDADADSGNITLDVSTPAGVRAHAASGDVSVLVPPGAYRVQARADSGDKQVGFTDDPKATVLLDVSADSGNVTLTAR